jgi:hypothetical protein
LGIFSEPTPEDVATHTAFRHSYKGEDHTAAKPTPQVRDTETIAPESIATASKPAMQ